MAIHKYCLPRTKYQWQICCSTFAVNSMCSVLWEASESAENICFHKVLFLYLSIKRGREIRIAPRKHRNKPMNNRQFKKKNKPRKNPIGAGHGELLSIKQLYLTSSLWVIVFCDLEDLWHFIKNFLIAENSGLSTCEALSFAEVQ